MTKSEIRRLITQRRWDNPRIRRQYLLAMHRTSYRKKMSTALKRSWSKGLRPTPGQRWFHHRLGAGWKLEYCINGPRSVQKHVRIDIAYPMMKLAIEIDGSVHDKPSIQKRDRSRDQWLRKNGWTVFHVLEKNLRHAM